MHSSKMHSSKIRQNYYNKVVDLIKSLVPSLSLTLRFYNQHHTLRQSCIFSFNDLSNTRSYFYLNMKCSCRRSRLRRSTLVIHQLVDYRYQLLMHSAISRYIWRERRVRSSFVDFYYSREQFFPIPVAF